MITREDIQDEVERNRLAGRSKSARVFSPRVIHVHSTGRGINNPESVFVELVGFSEEKESQSIGEIIKKGVSSKILVRMRETLEIGRDDLLSLMDISRATYARRTREHGKLSKVETDRLYRFTRLYTLATNMFEGDREEALKWLKSPAYAFKGETPLEHAKTEFGAHEVETLIGRIEHGIPT